MSRVLRYMLFVLLYFSLWASPVSARDAILPQGDPRVQQSDAAEQERREEIRKNRLKQQGQGENYRIEGELQGGSRSATPDESPNGRQNTGIADPTVNPGQATGMKSIRGEIIKSEDNTHTVRQKSGEDRLLIIDEYTRGDTVLRLGDTITGTMTPQGRAIILKKKQHEP
ncbi:MAG: hypothetical protein KF693_00545 [Nitrospira sp.]|nr:hypothetical protein [Nitrospira sp.]